MKSFAPIALVLVAGAAGAGGYAAGKQQLWPRMAHWAQAQLEKRVVPTPAATGPVIYYQDPDGKAVYSAGPRQTSDGRDFRAKLASQDISFDAKPNMPAVAAVQDMATAAKILYYRNPMGLADTSPVPKKDSMGMDYLPVFAGQNADDSSVKISLGEIQRSGVKSQLVTLRKIITKLQVPGTVQLDERQVSVVAMRSDAFIDSVANVTTGDFVRKGEVLLQLYSPDIAAASAQYLSGLNNKGLDNGGALRRLQNLAVPEAVIAQIRTTRQIPSTIAWSAPQNGIVVTRNVSAGMKAGAGDVLFKLANISTIWVIADVPEYELGAVKLGASVSIQMRGMPGRVFAGHVDLIYPQITTATRSAKVRIQLLNPDDVLLPDMYADVEIADSSGAPVVAVPDDAVIDSGNRQVVILDKGNGRFAPTTVKLGQRGGGYTEIRNGVKVGDKVVVGANFLIDAESNLQAALRGMDASNTAAAKPELTK